MTASLLIAEPGDDLCAYLGHAYIRLECPKYKLDYCYSYESERILEHPWRFLAGDLKMGMFAIPTQEYLEIYRRENRGVRQYFFNLPPAAKQRLWKKLDALVEAGINVPYDPLGKSCAVAVLRVIGEACGSKKLALSRWPFAPDATMREIVRDHSVGYDWHRFFLCALFGTQFDRVCDPFNKVIIPADLLAVLMGATVDGQPILSETPVQLLPVGPKHVPVKITPLMVASAFAVLGVVSFFRPMRWISGLYLGFQAICGFFLAFLLLGSMLPLNPWNWLFVPFNPLPVLAWKWRRYWILPFLGILLVWMGFMIFWPHQLTDWAYVVLVGGFVAWYAGIYRQLIRK